VIRLLLLIVALVNVTHLLCGRFNLTRPKDVIERFGFLDWADKRIEPRFNIAPSQEIWTIVQEPLGEPFAQVATWGLKPFWLKGGAGKKPPPINARAESLLSSPMFRDALVSTRCLILATGFYEWQAAGGVRQPMHIQLRGATPFAFAGLWLPGNRGRLPSATIVTTRPNELMATIHTRMPAILRPEHERAWIDASVTDPAQVLALLAPYPAEAMELYPVSTLVNNWENEGEALIEPAPRTGALF
jgi:putative SOS response-associated peptidase YedK